MLALTWHIVKKDLRALRWPIAAWLVLVVLQVVLAAVVPQATISDGRDTRQAYESIVSLLEPTRMLVWCLIVALLVQADPLVGTDAFWLTRPIPRRVLLASKAAFAALVLILPGLVLYSALMAILGVPAREILLVLPDMLLGVAVPIAFMLLAAALTPNLTHLAVWSVGLFVLFTAGVGFTVQWREVTDDALFHPPLPVRPDPMPRVAMMILLAIGLGYVIWHQYRTRRRGQSAILAVIVVAVPWIGGWYWPRPLSFYREPQLPREWADPARSPLRLANDIRYVSDTPSASTFVKTQPRYREIAGPVVLHGVPSGHIQSPFTVRATLRTASGTRIEGMRAHPIHVDVERGSAPQPTGLSFLKDGRALPSTSLNLIGRIEEWPVLLRIPVEQAQQVGSAEGEYTGTFQYMFTRRDELGVVPLREHTRFHDGPHGLAIRTVAQRGDACEVGIVLTHVRATAHVMSNPTLAHRFRHRPTNTWLEGALRSLSLRGLGAFGAGSVITSGNPWFMVDGHRLRLFRRDPNEPGGELPVSCQDIDIVLTRERYAGRLERTLTIPNFRVDAQPRDFTRDDERPR